MTKKVFTFNDIKIREVKGKYYVYLLEKDKDCQRRDRYVDKLKDVVKFYISSGGLWTRRSRVQVPARAL
ncbi:putative integrase [Sulfurisphaera ohwakuensis]|uniref:Integrase n=1 Tax=Sulfurisphaera ohwakuensis TaxID=69656 RepID=A0A650CKX7_SULOH|nr:integrase [Sulfurisphaera ohwakuensis]